MKQRHCCLWVLITGFIALLVVVTACQARPGRLGPARSTPEVRGVILGEPMTVDFVSLNANPETYLSQFIRVSGTYMPLPLPNCAPNHGPHTSWALVAEGLRLDAAGYEWLLPLIPEGLPMVVDGFWRRYQGPLGCGKGAPAGLAWYLETARIVEPNPLAQTGVEAAGPPAVATAPPSLLPTSTPPPAIGATPTSPPAVLTMTPSRPAAPSMTPTSSLVSPTPTWTIAPTLPGQTSTAPAPTPGSTATLGPGTPTPAATATHAPTPTPLPPPPATSTPGGGGCGPYPCPPSATPVPSASPTSGYP